MTAQKNRLESFPAVARRLPCFHRLATAVPKYERQFFRLFRNLIKYERVIAVRRLSFRIPNIVRRIKLARMRYRFSAYCKASLIGDDDRLKVFFAASE